MSGVECAGLVLAVLPLAIEAAKSYKNGVNSIRNVLSSSRRDDDLEDFYQELWMEMFFLDRQLRDTVDAFPFLTEDRKASLLKAENLNQWTLDSDVAEALQHYFNSDTDRHAFMLIMSKIVQLLAQLIKDETTHIDKKQTVSRHPLSILSGTEPEYASSFLTYLDCCRTSQECTGS